MRFHNYRHVKFSFGCQQNMHVIDFKLKLKIPAMGLKITLFVIVKSLISELVQSCTIILISRFIHSTWQKASFSNVLEYF